jgi:hypothetical protein
MADGGRLDRRDYQRPFEDVNLLARMGAPDQCRSGADLDMPLDDHAPEGAQIVLLQTGAPQSRRLL